MSASSKMMKGALPPSSIEVFTTVSAASRSRIRPTSVDPVNDSLRTRGSLSIAETTAPDFREGSTLTTPSGTPASASRPPMASAVSGVSEAGLSTTVQPAASAGPILRVAIAAGKFHGVTSTETPTGCRMTRILFAPEGACISTPSIRTASSAYQRKNSAAYAASARASRSALPFSAAISRARDSAWEVISSKVRRRHSARCRGGVAAQPGSAPEAAPTASSASSTVPSATSASASSVAGSMTGSVPPPRPPVHSPPISSRVGTSMPTSSVRLLLTAPDLP